MEENLKISNYGKYKKRLEVYVGKESAEKIIEVLGGDDAIVNATYAGKEDSGLAYDGSFTKTVLTMTGYAININEMLPEAVRADKNSIAKVCLLSQIAKVLMFTPNPNDWEKEKRGVIYTFKPLPGALRTGERSILIAMNCGVTFTGEEFEAMRILDKDFDDDNYSKIFSSVLSVVIKQANEIINVINRK
jgi:hypothetical protein